MGDMTGGGGKQDVEVRMKTSFVRHDEGQHEAEQGCSQGLGISELQSNGS